MTLVSLTLVLLMRLVSLAMVLFMLPVLLCKTTD